MRKPDQTEDKESENCVDIADFVLEVERFSKLIEPFAFALFAVDDIRRWKIPNVTAILWLVSTACCLILTQGAVFMLVAFLVIVIATASLFQLHTRILDKVLPDTRKLSYDTCSDEENNTLSTVREFRYSLIQMHDFVIKCNEYLSYFYAILKWDITVPAIIFHTEICTLLLALVVFPTTWIALMLVTWFFLGHQDTLNYFKKQWTAIQGAFDTTSSESGETKDGQNGIGSTASSDKNSQKSNLDSRSATDAQEKDDLSDADLDENTLDVDNDSMTKLDPAPSKPGMVARLLELKRRRQQLTSENCFACKVSFSSFLKRRYYCRHCGNHFCNKCCNQKVPRSVFGATAPAAQTETVLVCSVCHDLLNKDKDKVS